MSTGLWATGRAGSGKSSSGQMVGLSDRILAIVIMEAGTRAITGASDGLLASWIPFCWGDRTSGGSIYRVGAARDDAPALLSSFDTS